MGQDWRQGNQLNWVTGQQEILWIQIRTEAVGMQNLGEVEELLRR